MNEKQRENEAKIFKVIQDLKDSVFGLHQSYVNFCYTDSPEEGLTFSPERADAFAEELCAHAREARTYSAELSEVMPLFFRTSLRLLSVICGRGDWIFVSFRKLAKAALKSAPEEESVLERIVKSQGAALDAAFPGGGFRADYEAFRPFMGRVDAEGFYHCAKNAVEAFIDSRSLNVLDRDRATATAVARISRLAAAIDRDLARPGEWDE